VSNDLLKIEDEIALLKIKFWGLTNLRESRGMNDYWTNKNEALKQIIMKMEASVMLDVGGFTGYFLSPFKEIPYKICLDLSSNALRIGRENFQDLFFIHADGTSPPFRENQMDVITCFEVLEHIPNYKSALKKMYNLLKGNGLLLISVPNYFDFFTLPLNIFLKYLRTLFGRKDQNIYISRKEKKYRKKVSQIYNRYDVHGEHVHNFNPVNLRRGMTSIGCGNPKISGIGVKPVPDRMIGYFVDNNDNIYNLWRLFNRFLSKLNYPPLFSSNIIGKAIRD